MSSRLIGGDLNHDKIKINLFLHLPKENSPLRVESRISHCKKLLLAHSHEMKRAFFTWFNGRAPPRSNTMLTEGYRVRQVIDDQKSWGKSNDF